MTTYTSLFAQSPQRSLFSHPLFLQAVGWGGEFDIVRDDSFWAVTPLGPLRWSQFHSALLSPDLHAATIHASTRGVRLLEPLAKRQLSMGLPLSFHPTVADLRPWLWASSHRMRPGQAIVRYTGYIIFNQSDNETLPRRANSIRRLRRDYGQPVEIYQSVDIPRFLEIMKCSSRPPLTRSDLTLLEDISSTLLESRMGQLWFAEQAPNISTRFVATFGDTAYMLFGTSIGDRTKPLLSLRIDHAIFKCLRRSGITIIDWCGLNDRNRGVYKASWPTELVSYIEISVDPLK